MISILDTYPQVQKRLMGRPFGLETWRDYADHVSAELAAKCLDDIRAYDYEHMVLPVLTAALAESEKLEAAHQSFLSVTDGLADRLREALHTELDCTILLYFGLCCAAGWATELEGRPAVLLGLEKIVELDWWDERSMVGLVYHELGHLWHFQRRSAPDFETSAPALWQLYTEGIAMHCEQRLVGDPKSLHQYDEAWKQWCAARETALFREYLRRTEAGESVQDFFGDWCSYEGHSDVGYYLGSVLVRAMSEQMDDEALLNCSAEQVYEWLKAAAQNR